MSKVIWEQSVLLKCSECCGDFELSAFVVEVMWIWEDESGDLLVCAFCYGVYEVNKLGDGSVPEEDS